MWKISGSLICIFHRGIVSAGNEVISWKALLLSLGGTESWKGRKNGLSFERVS